MERGRPGQFDSAFSKFIESTKLEERGVDVSALRQFILTETIPKTCIAAKLSELREPLAAIEHERWAHWQRYLHSKCRPSTAESGALEIPRELVAQWERQIRSAYENLSDTERDSDREQVDRYLSFIADRLGTN